MSRASMLVATATLLAGSCSGPPPTPWVDLRPAQPSVRQEPVRAVPASTTFSTRTASGLGVTVTEAHAGEQAQLQLCFLVGASFVAPGLAELAVETIVRGADASRGRPSLLQAIARLGGFVRVAIGPVTTWIELRVPPSRWQAAQTALLRALEAPPLSRGQLERIRDEVVQERTAATQADPMLAMAQALMLAEPDTASHIAALLDRDVSEIALFQTRLLRPERALFVMHVPAEPNAAGSALAQGTADTLGAWRPAAIVSPEPRILPRTFQSGCYWSPNPATDTCQVAWLQFLPALTRRDAADVFTMHSCCTLDGAGGRLERLQRERGLDQVRWRSEFVQGADSFALLLRTELPSADVPKLWQVVQAARNSLRDVPPSASELELARRRAALTAGLGMFGDLSRQRVQTGLTLFGSSKAAFDHRLQQLAQPGTLDVSAAANAYLELPSMCIAVDGKVPPDATGVRTFRLLSPGLGVSDGADLAQQTAAATPWIERASEGAGGIGLLKRMIGYECEGRLVSQQAPPAVDVVEWRPGSLRRTRQLLGQEIATVLAGSNWTERLGDRTQDLSARDAGLLHREMERHPLALLAACARGQMAFHAVAQRSVGDRNYMVLEATGDHFDRLRMHIDTISHLVRVVEVWETTADGTTVHLQDSWSDYRSVAGMRVPFRRVTTQDDGQNSVETQFTRWQPTLSAP